MRLNLKINTEFKNLNKEKKILKLIYNLYKSNKTFLIFSWFGLILYKNLIDKNIKLNFYKKIITKKYKLLTQKKISKFKIKIFGQVFNEIKNILINKIKISDKKIIDIKRINFISSQEIIYDKIENITYKNIKDKRMIYKFNNFIIKEYTFYDLEDNYVIVSIINEILLNIYGYILLINYKNKEYFNIPKIHHVKLIKYKNNFTKKKIKIFMNYINLKINIQNITINYLDIYRKIKKFLSYLMKNKLYHNDTHKNNLIIKKNKIILLDFGKATLNYAFNPSISGFPKVKFDRNKKLNKLKKKYIILVIKNYLKLINLEISKTRSFIFKIY